MSNRDYWREKQEVEYLMYVMRNTGQIDLIAKAIRDDSETIEHVASQLALLWYVPVDRLETAIRRLLEERKDTPHA